MDVSIGGLQELQDNIFDVFADVARFGQRRGVHDRKGYVEHARKRLREQSLSGARRSHQQNIRFREFDVAGLAIQENALVMVVNGDCEFLLSFILADYVAIQKRLDLRRTRQPAIRWAGLLALLIFENLLADAHALVANIRARIFRWRTDKFLHLLLSLMAERTTQRLFWSKPFHRASPLSSETTAPTPKQYLILERKIRRKAEFHHFYY